MKHNLSFLPWGTTIRDAIQQMEKGGYSSAFFLTSEGKYAGEFFVNDLRRLLISGTTEDEPVSNFKPRHTLYLTEADLRNTAAIERLVSDLKLSRATYVPLINVNASIVEVYSLGDLTQAKASNDFGKSFEEQKVLVVGGAGYLGSVLVQKLLQNGYSVRVLDNFIYGKKSLDWITNRSHVEIVQGDMRDVHTIVSSLNDVGSVILLAAIVGDPASKVRPGETIETNLLAAQALATACKLQHINRFIYASTCSVYGTGGDILDEGAPLNPVSLYARTKIASEEIILKMGNDYFAPTILRMGTLYGFSHRMRFDLVVNTMTMKAFTERKITVFGGNQWRPLLHVDDAADAYVLCLKSELHNVGNQIFNVGSDTQNYQIDQIAERISRALGGIPIQRDESSLDVRDYRVSFKKIQDRLLFIPRGSVEDAARLIYQKLEDGSVKNPSQKIYYNHYFDSSEE